MALAGKPPAVSYPGGDLMRPMMEYCGHGGSCAVRSNFRFIRIPVARI